MYRFVVAVTILCATMLPVLVRAHEVYVLPPDVVQQAIHTPAFSEVAIAVQDSTQFVLWAFIAAFVVGLIFFVSISRSVERVLDPYLVKLPYYAPFVGRVTIGLAFCASAYYGALFGPELPLIALFGTAAPIVQAVLFCIGVLLVLGAYPRVAAVAALTVFVWA
jgi:type II secretory pathway component PulF